MDYVIFQKINTMASIKILLRNKPNKEGLYPVIMRIVKNRKSKAITLGMTCDLKDWDDKNNKFKRSYPNYIQRNRVLLKLNEKALKIIDEFRVNETDFTLNQFEDKFRGNQKQRTNIISFFEEIVEEMERAGRMGNARAYEETKLSLIRYAGKTIYFKEVTATFLEKYEVYMRERGNEDGGIAFKMREIRAVFNKAIMRNLISQETYPFKFYKISKLKGKANKRALSIEEFKQFRDLDLSEIPYLKEAHYYFLFSFYTRGMNFVDMMKLQWSDIQNGRIYYKRSKTKGQFNIEITEKVEEILQFYKSQNRPTNYVFPILLHENLTPKQIANRKKKVMQRYNSKLKELAKIAGIEKTITTYVARHSFATILKQKGTSTDVISELMGHADVNITKTYLKEFENEVLDLENRKLLDL